MKKILIFFERFLKIDLTDVLSGGFWLGVGKGAQIIITLFISIAIARYLTKDAFGEYRYILSIFAMLGILALPGLSTSATRSVARGYEGTFLASTRMIFLSSLLITAVGFCIAIFFFFQGNSALAYGFAAAALLTPLVEGLGNWKAYLDGKKQFKKKTIRNLTSYVFYGIVMVSAIAVIYFFELSRTHTIALLVAAYFLGQGVPNIIFSIRSQRDVPPNAPVEHGSIRYGYHLNFLDILPTIAYNLDAILLFNFLGPSALAVYSFALAPIQQMRTSLDIGLLSVFPKISSKTTNTKDTSELKRVFLKKIMRILPFSGIAIITYIVAAPYLYQYLFPRYAESAVFSQVLALSLVLFPLNIATSALKAEGDIKKIAIINVVSPLSKIGALIILVPLFDIWGVVWARVVSHTFGYLFSFFIFTKYKVK